MLAIHFCSDQAEAAAVLEELLAEVRGRVRAGQGVLEEPAVRVFWVNPVADLRVMNLLEDAGGRVCGTEYLFCHALDTIPEDLPPMEALARTALADPMVGSPADRAERICARRAAVRGPRRSSFRGFPVPATAAWKAALIGQIVRRQCGVPVMEIEVPPITDALEPTLRTRLEALIETVKEPDTAMIFAGIDAGSRTVEGRPPGRRTAQRRGLPRASIRGSTRTAWPPSFWTAFWQSTA